jgi:hypothetical protein
MREAADLRVYRRAAELWERVKHLEHDGLYLAFFVGAEHDRLLDGHLFVSDPEAVVMLAASLDRILEDHACPSGAALPQTPQKVRGV